MRRMTLLTTLVALVAMLGLEPGLQVSAVAASACGGWASTSLAPPSIRVLRTSTGSVDVVPFRTYVEKVMAAEWPSWYPTQALAAGAIAVKQYAWYYAMHRRSWYVAGSGACYDVRDDTYDQVYSPGRTPTRSQLVAVDATWQVTVRRYGRFILTGYGAGTTGACGAGLSTGRNRLAQRGVRGCALAGMDAAAILHVYMDPGLTIVTGAPGSASPSPPAAPSVTPTPTAPPPPPSASPSASPSAPPSPAQPPAPSPAAPPSSGPVATPSPSPAAAVSVLVGEHSTSIAYRGRWADAPYKGYSGGNASWSRTAGSTATFTFTGTKVSWIGPRGPTRGRARVLVDGREVARVDLYARTFSAQAVLFTSAFARGGRHTLTIQVLSAPARPYVAIDGFVVTR